ncbi:MAG: hypothetical protein IJ371_01965 [Clostridia bacterium]|nr:hypothetical protein [Clostridia bacterium]
MKDLKINFDIDNHVTYKTVAKVVYTCENISETHYFEIKKNMHILSVASLFCDVIEVLRNTYKIDIIVTTRLLYLYLKNFQEGYYYTIKNSDLISRLNNIFSKHNITIKREGDFVPFSIPKLQQNKQIKSKKQTTCNTLPVKKWFVDLYDTVTWLNLNNNQSITKTIVPAQLEIKAHHSFTHHPRNRFEFEVNEKQLDENKISMDVPIAKNSLGKAINDCIKVCIKGQVTKFRITNIIRN